MYDVFCLFFGLKTDTTVDWCGQDDECTSSSR